MLLCTFAFTGLDILEDTTLIIFAFVIEGVENMYHIYISEQLTVSLSNAWR